MVPLVKVTVKKLRAGMMMHEAFLFICYAALIYGSFDKFYTILLY
jgi:hypothetical protein